LTVGLAPDDHDLLAALRAGDEEAFGQLVDRYYPAMLHVARGFVATTSEAEEVVQETLLAVVEGLPCVEGQLSLKTWMFRILVNRSKTRGARGSDGNDLRPPQRTPTFVSTDSTTIDPMAPVLRQELGEAICAAVDRLPARQRTVLVLRDIQGWTSLEVCQVLGLSDAHQRILLHRARTSVHDLLVSYLN
jgi:RNA polymerase sigma-70 factor (ECF subfamily)